MIPDTLDGWSLDLLRQLVAQGAFEADRFSFKEMLPDARNDDEKRRPRRTIAAFANGSGGLLVFGVKDGGALPPETRVVGTDAWLDFRERFGAHASQCEPTPAWTHRNPALRLDDGRLVHVVLVPGSSRRPHGVFEDDRWWFPKRTNRGTEPMSLEEIRGAFVDTARRRTDLTWVKSEVQRIRDLARNWNISATSEDPLRLVLVRFDVALLRSPLPRVFGEIGGDQILVSQINHLVERCVEADAALAPRTAYLLRPRERSASGRRYDIREVVREFAPQIVMSADYVLQQFRRVGL